VRNPEAFNKTPTCVNRYKNFFQLTAEAGLFFLFSQLGTVPNWENKEALLNIPHKFYYIKFGGRTKMRHEKFDKMSKNINHASFVLLNIWYSI